MALNAKLHIETALRNERTILQNSFCTPPFKIADITEDKSQCKLQLMIMSSSPGVLDGDEYEIKIDLTEKSSLSLATQSYQRLYQMKDGAKQMMAVNMREGSSLVYVPHPLVPHENSIFISKNKISMEENCSLIWGEIMSCGRKMNGEVFKFSSYHSVTEVFFKNKLVVKENILMKPSEINVKAIGQLEGFTHQASLLCISSNMDVEEKKEIIVRRLKIEENIAFGISSLAVNGLIVRLLGYKSEQLFDLLRNISTLFSEKNLKENIHVT
jgi:urease accessory protein